jgi:hypothetical protein
MLRRHLQAKVTESLGRRPALFLMGPRQAGKSTLVLELLQSAGGGSYRTLDDPDTLRAAELDPTGFVAGDELQVIDEIQRAPRLLPAIKASIDRDRRPGRFLLTGSSNVLALPRVAESLAGRVALHVLWPLSQGEIRGVREGFLDQAFGAEKPSLERETLPRAELTEMVLRGGYPEQITGDWPPAQRTDWFRDYVTTLLQRDVREFGHMESLTQFPNLLRLLASRTANLMNAAEVSRASGLPYTTLNRYLAILEGLFLFQPLEAWTGNATKRLTRARKIHIVDSGLAAQVSRLRRAARNRTSALLAPSAGVVRGRRTAQTGRLVPRRIDLTHFRTPAGDEVDVVMEQDDAGSGIEVKAAAPDGRRSASAGSRRPAGHAFTAASCCTGRGVTRAGDRIDALPVSALWRWGRRRPPVSHDCANWVRT